MSIEAIQEVTSELQNLPESDQRLVLDFLQALKRRRRLADVAPVHTASNLALKEKKGRLVFTGKVDAPQIDWLSVVREEREEEIMRQILPARS